MAAISIPITEYKELNFRAQKADELEKRASRLEQENKLLRDLLRLERIKKYGRKSEALSDGQLELLGEEPSVEETEIEKEAELPEEQKPVAKKQREHAGRNELPAHLPRKEKIISVASEQRKCPCCGEERRVIGYEEKEELDLEPIKYFVRVIKREKLACPKCPEAGVETAPIRDKQIIEKSKLSSAVIVDVLIKKYGDHLPLYRQEASLEFDGFGRRIQTTYTPVVKDTPVTEKTESIASYYDPNVEFLEIGVKVNDKPTTWKAYGVDKDGTHGGLQGLGGLEAIIESNKTYSIINDAFGNVVTTYDGTEIKRVPTQAGSYGPLPGSLALPLSAERGLHEAIHWQGRYIDPTGYIHIGKREFNPANGTWISADPLGHAASWSLHSYANGNPIEYTDPTGRIATKFAQDTGLKDAYYSVGDTAINAVPGGLSLLSWGMGAAMKAAGMPYGHLYQQAGAIDERLSPYARAGFYDQNSVVATAVAAGSVIIAPGSVSTKLASRGIQPLFGASASAVTKGSGQTTILGENMLQRVIPFAEATGARRLPFGTTSEGWNALTPYQRWKLNDGALRARINEGDAFRYIGIDPARKPAVRARFDLTGSELLRLNEREIPFESVSPAKVLSVIGRP